MEENKTVQEVLHTNNYDKQAKAVFWEAQLAPLQLTYTSQSIALLLPQLSKQPGNFWDYIYSEDKEFVWQCYRTASHNNAPQSIQYRICPDNNTCIWVRDVFELRKNHHQQTCLAGMITKLPDTGHNLENILQIRENALKEIVQATAHKSGQAYFNQIALSLNKVIGADFVVIGEKMPSEDQVKTVAVSKSGELWDNFNYSLDGSPCQTVIGKNTCVYPKNVATLFPKDVMLADLQIEGYLGTPVYDYQGKDLGLIIALYKHPITNAPYTASLFELFANQVGTEMNRIKSESRLQESEMRFRRFFREDEAIKLLINPENRKIEDANRAAEKFYGYNYEELTQLKISDLNILDEKGIAKALGQAKQLKKNYFQFKHRLKNGQIKDIEAYSTPLQFGEKSYLLATVHDITENIKNKKALLTEKQFVDSIIQHAAEGISVCHQTDQHPFIRFTVWNHQMEKITGYALHEINEVDWYQIVLPSEKAASRRMTQLLQGDNLINEPWTITHKEGEHRTLSISTTIINKENNIPYIMAIIQDITEQKQARQALESRQARMHLLYQITSNVSEEIDTQLQNALKLTTDFFGAEAGIISSIKNDDFLIVNSYSIAKPLPPGTKLKLSDTVCKITMTQEKALIIENVQSEQWRNIISKKVSSGSYIGTVVHVFGQKYGSLCVISSKAHLGYDAIDGEFISLLARWIGNLIERQLKEKDLRESEERYRSLTESAPIGIILHSAGKVIYANPFSAEVLEATQAQLVGSPAMQLIHPDSVPIAAKRAKELYEKKGRYAMPLEEKIVTLKNNVKDCLISGIAIDYKGQPAICNVFADITERKKVEKELLRKKNQLEKANKELEELTYVASHDLKAPLANLQGLMTLMEDADGIKNNSLYLFEKMQLSVLRMQTTLNSLNEVIALKQEMEIKKEKLNFNQLFDNIKLSLETQITQVNAIIKTNFSAAPDIEYPLFHLKSILQNLLTNAIKYRDPCRPLLINVSTIKQKKQVCLVVADNGLGMDLSKSKEKLFGLFKRLHIHVEGKGIGLYILKSIVDSHQGSIEVESELNKGTTFKIYLGND